jgi:hypothetical protein
MKHVTGDDEFADRQCLASDYSAFAAGSDSRADRSLPGKTESDTDSTPCREVSGAGGARCAYRAQSYRALRIKK